MKRVQEWWYHFKVEYEKNIKVVISNKFSFSILFFLPIFLIILMSMLYFNQNSYIYEVAMIDDDSEISKIIRDELQKSGFYVNNYNSIEECSKALKKGIHKACIEIQPQISSPHKVYVEIDNSNPQSKEILKNILQSSLVSGRDTYAIKNIDEALKKLELLETTANSILEKHPKLLNHFNKIEKEISSLELILLRANRTLDPSDLNTDETKDTLLKITTSKENFITGSKEFSSQTITIIDNLSLTIDNSNITSAQKNEFQNILDDIEDELQTYTIQRDSYGSSSYYTNKLEEEIENFDEKIVSAQSRLGDSFNSQKTIISSIDNSTNYLKAEFQDSTQYLNSSLENSSLFTLRNANSILYPYTYEINESFSSSNKPLVSSFPFIFSSLIFILSLFLGAILSFKQNNCNSKLRVIMAKPSFNKLLFSQITSIVTLIFIQLGIIISIFYYVFLRDFIMDLFIIFPLMILFIVVSTLIGMILGHIARSQLSLVVTALGTLFLVFLFSGKILPIELLHGSAGINYLLYNPYLLIESILREIILFSLPISTLYTDIGIILLYIVICSILVSLCTSVHHMGKAFFFFRKIKNFFKTIPIKKKKSP